ncbi:MAG: S8 family serine peptidase [Bacteroidales bacterium]
MFACPLDAQPDNLYRIYLTDKEGSIGINQSASYFSPEALQRRRRYSVPLDELDVPVSKIYLDSLSWLGLTIVCTSRWMNTVVVAAMDEAKREKVLKFNFVRKIVQIADTLHRWQARQLRKFYTSEVAQRQKTSILWPQIALNRGYFLHEKGFLGKGIRIAIIDAGFEQTRECLSLQSLFASGRILGTRNFVFPDSGIYTATFHGTAVLSVMAASNSDSLIGTAPMASYLLLRSEDVTGEYPAEEDFWVAAAEWADSMGVDIINTSLGYTQFDNPVYNYRYSDMNGATAFISQAATIAAAKGMLVVVSAGNEGNDEWHYIGAPADARGILAVGAIDEWGMRAPFSSVGPASDGRIKPEIMAMGRAVRAEYAPNDFRPVSGTSFSAPIISGLAACLWEAYPQLPPARIREAIIRSSSQYYAPDSLMGYGIPDFAAAYAWLQQNANNNIPFALYPNPCRDELTLEGYNPDQQPLIVSCVSLTGRQIFVKRTYSAQKTTFTDEIKQIPAGMYVLQIKHSTHNFCLKFIKL